MILELGYRLVQEMMFLSLTSDQDLTVRTLCTRFFVELFLHRRNLESCDFLVVVEGLKHIWNRNQMYGQSLWLYTNIYSAMLCGIENINKQQKSYSLPKRYSGGNCPPTSRRIANLSEIFILSEVRRHMSYSIKRLLYQNFRQINWRLLLTT